MLSMRPDPEIVVKNHHSSGQRRIPALILSAEDSLCASYRCAVDARRIHSWHEENGVHVPGGGYGQAVWGGCGVAGGDWMAFSAPYPAAPDDCYAALLYMKSHAAESSIRDDQIMVGVESAGGGLCAVVYIKARGLGLLMSLSRRLLYPMLDDRETETSRDNHGKV